MKKDRDHDFEFCPVLAELVRLRRIVGKNGKVFGQLAALSSGIIYSAARWFDKIQLTVFMKKGTCERNWNAPFRSF